MISNSVEEIVVKVDAASSTDLVLYHGRLPRDVILVVTVPHLGVKEEDKDHGHGGSRHEQTDHLTWSLKPGHLVTIRVSRGHVMVTPSRVSRTFFTVNDNGRCANHRPPP